MSDELFLFMEPGNMSLNMRKARDSFTFPCGNSHGVELFIHHSAMQYEIPKIWRVLEINLP
jgi:hypothetical protein